MQTIAELTARFPRSGCVTFIGIRPARRVEMVSLDRIIVGEDGLAGDHRNKPGLRAVTLIQHEHLAAIASLCGIDRVDPALLRRNFAVQGINLTALRGRKFRIGMAVLEATDVCAPCSRMEEALGPGGYNAMRGHGGITANVIEAGAVAIGDIVVAV